VSARGGTVEKLYAPLYRFLIECARRIWPGTTRAFLVKGNPYKYESVSPDLNASLRSGRVTVETFQNKEFPWDAVLIGVDEVRVAPTQQADKQQQPPQWTALVWMVHSAASRAATVLVTKKGDSFSFQLTSPDWEPDISRVIFKGKATLLGRLPKQHRAVHLQKDQVLLAFQPTLADYLKPTGILLRTYDRRMLRYREARVVKANELSPDIEDHCFFSPNGLYLLVTQRHASPIRRRIIDVRTGATLTALVVPPECYGQLPLWVDDRTWVEVAKESEQSHSLLVVRYPFKRVEMHLPNLSKEKFFYPLTYNARSRRLIIKVSVIQEEPARFLSLPFPEKSSAGNLVSFVKPVDADGQAVRARPAHEEFLWLFQVPPDPRVYFHPSRPAFYNRNVWRSELSENSFRQVVSFLDPQPPSHATTVECAFDYDGTPVIIYGDALSGASFWRVR
jgi:hypothetical protein